MKRRDNDVRGAAVLKAIATVAWLFAAGTAAADSAGQITHLSGVLAVRRDDGTTRILSVRSEVRQGDLLSTQQESWARIKFNDGGEVVLRPTSQLRIDQYAFAENRPSADSFVVSLLKGGLRAVSGLIGKRNRERLAYKAPTATIGVRGTHFGMLFCNNDCAQLNTAAGTPPANGLHVEVASGAIVLTNPGGQAQLDAGQFGFVADARTAPVLVPPERAVPITLPPSISNNAAGGRSVGDAGQDECSL